MAGTTVTTPGASTDAVRQALNGELGDANIASRGISFGRVAPGLAGKLDAAYGVFSTKANTYIYDVPHSLGRVPGFVVAVHMENVQVPNTHFHVIGWDRDKWTETTVRVHVHVIVGSLGGGQVTVLIGGAR